MSFKAVRVKFSAELELELNFRDGTRTTACTRVLSSSTSWRTGTRNRECLNSNTTNTPTMSKTLKKKKHWANKVQEYAVSWGGGELSNVLEIVGGAELGEFPYLGHGSPPLSVALRWHAGRAPSPGDVLLEVNGTPVSGLTHRDTLAVIRHFREPVRLKTVKPECFIKNGDNRIDLRDGMLSWF
ncbi:hypothetical protein QTP86_021518 [Hemibagrus guttatus]|nr:hypothetical protein QTP86_021518 [Hemibagrus guttatus]